jgi:hypothetical protein
LREHVTGNEIFAYRCDGVGLEAVILRLGRQRQQRGAGNDWADYIHRGITLITASNPPPLSASRFTATQAEVPASDVRCTTALPPKADVHPRSCYVAFVPQADSCTAANGTAIRSPHRRSFA